MAIHFSTFSGRFERRLVVALGLLAMITGQGRALAQGRGGNQAAPAATPQAIAPKDLTGYWVSVVTEDWRWRMVVPVKGDFAGVPLNPEGRRVATMWDPAGDRADQCKAYGAATILRVPGRLHISWSDSNTLRIDTDSGTQTRLLHFTGPPSTTPQLQGYSAASWEGLPRRGRGAAAPNGNAAPDPTGYLKVVTSRMLPGYLRRNGVPYSANATVEEYLDRFSEPNGDNLAARPRTCSTASCSAGTVDFSVPPSAFPALRRSRLSSRLNLIALSACASPSCRSVATSFFSSSSRLSASLAIDSSFAVLAIPTRFSASTTFLARRAARIKTAK